MREIMHLADHANGYIADKAPWSLAKEDGKEQEVLAICTTARLYTSPSPRDRTSHRMTPSA